MPHILVCLAGTTERDGRSEDEKIAYVIPAMIAIFLGGLELVLALIKVILL